jgi:hypothetical protein
MPNDVVECDTLADVDGARFNNVMIRVLGVGSRLRRPHDDVGLYENDDDNALGV